MCYVTLDSYFSIVYNAYFSFNRSVVINHTNICLDLIFLEKAYFIC
jgi:hypothetical protein